MGVIDTGADTVLVPRGIAKRLGLRPIRNTIAILASGEQRAAISYMGVLEIPAIGYRDEIEMTAMTEGGESNHILLGRNFLREFLVTIDCANDVVHYQRADHGYSPPIDDE
ncbi:retropepsin-like aspartic protease [Phenylobacterium sp.]|uniref:retropepsin-like aspartic protease n=1 Tax=Phenylobacterium sp. TaxID=1871053 RepID=UPI0025F89B59|nr:retropepsin-like aspartic protease [Phenylobacterium sp.]